MKTSKFLLMLLLLLLITNNTIASNIYYNKDGSYNVVNFRENELTVRLDSQSGITPQDFASSHSFILEDTNYVALPGNFYLFHTQLKSDLGDIVNSLRDENDVLMVNYVINTNSNKAIYLTNHIICHFNPDILGSEIDSVLNLYNLIVCDLFGGDSSYLLLKYENKTENDIFDISNQFYNTGLCQFAYPHFIYTDIFSGIPQDPYFSDQWHLNNTGQTGGTPDADIDMPEAWDLKPDSLDGDYIILAILDTGFDLYHEDLPADCFRGSYDAIGGTFQLPLIPDIDPSPPCQVGTNPLCYHGTAVLGFTVPIINNSVGLSGIESSIKIMPIKIVGDFFGFMDNSGIIKAFIHTRSGPISADVVSCSWTLENPDPGIEEQLQWLYDSGKPVFFCSGNQAENAPSDTLVQFPAYLPTVFAVGATDHNDQSPSWSCRGNALDIMAPGVDLWSFDLSGGDGINPYGETCNGDMDYTCSQSGTSYSVPIVAALAAKILRHRPDLLIGWQTAEPMYELLRNTATDLGTPGWDPVYGWGRVSAFRAMFAIARGDVDHDFKVSVADAVYIINYIFSGGPPPTPYLYLGDANCDGKVNTSDAVYIINFVFTSGEPPKICYLNLPE